MTVRRIRMVFAMLGLVAGSASAMFLYRFFGPDGENLRIAGIPGPAYLVVFPLLSAIVAAITSSFIFGRPKGVASRGSGFGRGAIVGLVTFVAVVLCHGIFMIAAMDLAAASLITVSALLFGGIALGLPAIMVAGVVGAVLDKCTKAR